jgi:hypothetical protein
MDEGGGSSIRVAPFLRKTCVAAPVLLSCRSAAPLAVRMHRWLNSCVLCLLRWTFVDDPATDEIVRWGSQGKSFIVVDLEAFTRTILPSYFKHSK